ncbi:hypothetical protein ES703_26158 [subsurface metagenome]
MKRAKWFLGLLLVGTLLFVGCSSEGPTPPPTVNIPIEQFQNQPHIDVVMYCAVGRELTVTLGSNPTTGYQWTEEAVIRDDDIIEQTSRKFVPPETDKIGASGKEVWVFRGLKEGTTTILLIYSRSWEEAGVGFWTVDITATIK